MKLDPTDKVLIFILAVIWIVFFASMLRHL